MSNNPQNSREPQLAAPSPKQARPKIIGHRGCRSAGVFENTARAAARAVAEGADIVEVDVVCTKDGHFVALHWPDASSTVLPPWKYRLAELPPVEGLAKIVEAVSDRVGLYLDIKQPLDDQQLLDLAHLVTSKGAREVIVGSVYRRVLLWSRKHRPEWIINFDCLPLHGAVVEARELGAHWINPAAFGVRRSFVDRALEAGLQFVPAGNENIQRQIRYAKWGAYALSTFYPARLRSVLAHCLGSSD